MLSEALQRNAKHEARLSNISDLSCPARRLKSIRDWKRGLAGFRLLRCSFASIRMTFITPLWRAPVCMCY